MKGYRFYLEYASPAHKRRKEHSGNVVAVDIDDRQRPVFNCGGSTISVTAAYRNTPNSEVGGVGVDLGYLRTRCRRVPERVAREVHPRMFAWLDSFEEE